jgi:hypothetical protein
MKFLSIIFIIFLLILSCNHNENKFYSTPISIEELKGMSEIYGINSKNINKAIETGLYLPYDTNCSKEIIVKPTLNFDWIDFNTDLDSKPNKAIKNILTSLYKIFGDPTITQIESYDYTTPPLAWVIDSVVSGNWAPQCGGIANITNRIINENSTNLFSKSVHLDYPIHTLNIVYFTENKRHYAVIFDAQNGFLFPYLKNEDIFVPINELEFKFEELDFYWLSDEILMQKRNFLTHVFPCNYLVDNQNIYHFSPKTSPYKFDRLSYSFHKYIWFDLQQIDKSKMKEDIVKKILDNTSL